MLISCPECERKVSDKAAACPECGYPIREWVEEQAAAEAKVEAASKRERVGKVDCRPCGARGFIQLDQDAHGRSGFTWCPLCGHSGRVVLCRSTDGYYAVSHVQLERFLSGELDATAPGVDHLGDEAPHGHRFPQEGPLVAYDEIPAWFVELLPRL